MKMKNLIAALLLAVVPSVTFGDVFLGAGVASFNGMEEADKYLYDETAVTAEIGYRHPLADGVGIQVSALIYAGMNGIGIGGGGFVRLTDTITLSAGYEVFNGRSNYATAVSGYSFSFTDESQWSAPFIRLDAMFNEDIGGYVKISPYNVSHDLSLTVCDSYGSCDSGNIPVDDTDTTVLTVGIMTQF